MMMSIVISESAGMMMTIVISNSVRMTVLSFSSVIPAKQSAIRKLSKSWIPAKGTRE